MMNKYAEERNLDFRFDALINPRFDGSNGPCRFRIPPTEVVELDLAYSKNRNSWKQLCQGFQKMPKETENLYNCSLNMWSFHITACGELRHCLLTQEPSFDLRQHPFSKCWPRLIEEFQAIKVEEQNKCQKCDLYYLCAPCPAWAQLENGNPNSVVPYICQIAHLRAEAFKKEGFILKGGDNNEKESQKALPETENR
jgi:radical SAM protein with 4Fe4S-binding SPASM domain